MDIYIYIHIYITIGKTRAYLRRRNLCFSKICFLRIYISFFPRKLCFVFRKYDLFAREYLVSKRVNYLLRK